MTVVLDPSVAPVATSLLQCLTAQLADVPNPPANVMFRVGVTVELLLSQYANECCQGLGWVRLVAVYPSSSFPQPDAVAERCGPVAWAAVLEMGAARCAPTPPASQLPTVDDWERLAEEVFADASAMRRALCCFADVDSDRQYLPGLWQPLPVEGGCAGGVMQVTVAVDACDCTT